MNVWTVPRDKESGRSGEVVVSKGSTELPSFELVSHLKAGDDGILLVVGCF